MFKSNKLVDAKGDATKEECEAITVKHKDCKEKKEQAPVNVVSQCSHHKHISPQVYEYCETDLAEPEPRLDLLKWCQDNKPCAEGFFASFINGIKRCYPALFPQPKKESFWQYFPGGSCVVNAPKAEECLKKVIVNKKSKLAKNTCMSSLCCNVLKGITITLEVLSIGAAIYYFMRWYVLRSEYDDVVHEVREAQNDRKVLEDELTKVQAKAAFVGDEIGDTKRHIMLSEIERITQYLNNAKSEINNLVQQKNALKEELNLALRERDKAKYEYSAAVDNPKTTGPRGRIRIASTQPNYR